ncbi:hypothetical protein JCM19055_986 [Geomicrobium sp. JCM 19055]|nr:hypothetical protein JCM19055_986 [Geomicrobium sp. JCM 19055]
MINSSRHSPTNAASESTSKPRKKTYSPKHLPSPTYTYETRCGNMGENDRQIY